MVLRLTLLLRSIAVPFVLAVLAMLMAAAPAMASNYFSASQVSSSDLSAFTKWVSLLPRFEYEQSSIDEQCDDDSCDSRRWEKMLKEQEGKTVRQQMRAVNDFFNAVKYIEDTDNWGLDDYWATPYEFMARGGDCEDYAIAKYISLKRLGVPEKHMRIVIVQDYNLNGTVHAILEVKVDGKPYILDNQATRVIAESKIYHYQPVYAINEKAWWAYQ